MSQVSKINICKYTTVVDLDAFGLRGDTPEVLETLRMMTKEQDPDIYRLVHQDDPLLQKYMDNPGAAFEEAQAIDPKLREVGDFLKAMRKRK